MCVGMETIVIKWIQVLINKKNNKIIKKVLTNSGAFTIMKTTKEQRTKDFKEL